MARKEPLRFAHPFFTTLPVEERPVVPGVGRRMTDFIATKLEKIPDPQRDPTMTLNEIIGQAGAKQIEASGSISFHAVGDTGHENGFDEEAVADAMAADYNAAHPEKSPAFLFHLGDVIYYDNTDRGYHAQFYVPYRKYPGKIIAIPGNHDGELFKFDGTSTGQKTTLEAFQKNFCQPKPGVPPAAGTIFREMVSQPGVYWLLNAPFVDIIGLYTNVAENPGFIEAPQIGQKQYDWLVKTLGAIKKLRDRGQRKALFIAVHHPPFSNGSHSGSTQMLADIDKACTQSGVMPDVVLAAHAHSYQRFTRTVNFKGRQMKIPFLVVGSGGRGLQPVSPATGQHVGDHSYDKSLMGFGYLTATVTATQVVLIFTQVQGATKAPFDKITVDLATNLVH
ncbi:metallophosphoesterase family protein [Flavisolibacter ginsenosidimutans]|uniref:Metallophosphoesterase n=1 Tax=Flavisolibacter ginsenosidimutans TaxID=661481 RepID=A0A5B8UIC9_9BACT|nr:metallophosphoesterase [Flavisolibacter ginsenosidimutans]QEC56424.1 metallophosphoesterase [Flavisolibacter ginsenosidimutans]